MTHNLDTAAVLIDMAKDFTTTSKQSADPALMYARAQALIAFETARTLEDLLALLKDGEWLVQTTYRGGEKVQVVSLLTE